MNSMLTYQPSPLSTPPSPTEAQAALKAQLAALTAQARDVSERLNALSLPARLPSEILSEIFLTHAARVQKEHLDCILVSSPDLRRIGSYFGWIHVARVCRRWREVALACTEFKAFLVFEGFTLPFPDAHAFASLPPDYPATVVYHQNVDYSCQRCTTWYCCLIGTEYIEENLPHIKNLVLLIECDNGTLDLWECMQGAAESLESLRVGLRGDAWTYHTSDRASKFTVPNGLLKGNTPRLRSLTTSHVSFSWTNTLLCPSLRHLEIIGHPGHRRTTDMAEFISALATLPHLETLIIDRLPAVKEAVGVVAHLPRLCLLRTSATVECTAFVLFHLRLPPSTSVNLVLERHTLMEAPSAQQALSVEFSKLVKDAPIHTMSWFIPQRAFMRADKECSCFRAWSETVSPLDAMWVSRPDIAPRLTVSGTEVADVLPLLRALPLPALQALHVEGPMSSREDWTSIFAGSPNLALLRVTGRVGYRLGTNLSRVAPAPAGGQGHVETLPIMPKLRKLEFVRVKFPPPRKPDDYEQDIEKCICDDCELIDLRWGKRGLDVQDLVWGLKRRRVGGAQDVEKIEFVGCPHMKMSHMKPLLRERSTVVFDGVVLSEDVTRTVL